nr:MAG TPA: DNA polymerase B [Bacteriophage sp.]
MVDSGNTGRNTMTARKDFRVVAIFDTETTNILHGAETRAYPILYIFNDLRDTSLESYDPTSDDVRFYRRVDEALAYIDDLIAYGGEHGYVPVIAAYNLMFDMQTLMLALTRSYTISVNAQTATSVYTLDLYVDDSVVCRFWDTFYLEMGGLRAMGETCGLPKAVGDWDYSLVRTPETPLTEDELFYARRDVQVIPQYLQWLLHANHWLTSDMLGSRVLTKTSLVRQMARREIGGRRVTLRDGKKLTLQRAFEMTCNQEFPRDYGSYALRKSCFRGGLTFTSAQTANVVVDNVASLDVTSMHHAFINGRRLPVKFTPTPSELLQIACERIATASLDDVLSHYDDPFRVGLHVAVRFSHLRLRKGTCFAAWGIAICPRSKFVRTLHADTDYSNNDRVKTQDNSIRERGYVDSAVNPVYAFGKLYSADECVLHVNEVELWDVAQVYEYDGMHVLYGESTTKTIIPPDYVTLQSNMLFARKTDVKNLIKGYTEGMPYVGDIPDSIPEGIARDARTGGLSMKFLRSYYGSTVKGQFNGIYGTQAQDVMKADYCVTETGDLEVDRTTVCTPENFAEKRPKTPRVLYTYGMRIVAGSRMHLLIAMMLIYRHFGERVTVTGGDTDSLKIRCDDDVSDGELLKCLQPLHNAIETAIDKTMRRVRVTAPDMASTLEHVGMFEVEDCGGSSRYVEHVELWNKARVSLDVGGRVHVTCAGLPRPADVYTIEDFLRDLMTNGHSFGDVVSLALGYDVLVDYEICHTLQRNRPHACDRYIGDVTDHRGETAHVDTPEAVGLYPSGRWLGESDKQANMENITYLRALYNRYVNTIPRELVLRDGAPRIVSMDGEILL